MPKFLFNVSTHHFSVAENTFKSQHVLNLFENIYNKILSDLSFSDIKNYAGIVDAKFICNVQEIFSNKLHLLITTLENLFEKRSYMGSKRITEEDEKSFFGTLNRKLIMKKKETEKMITKVIKYLLDFLEKLIRRGDEKEFKEKISEVKALIKKIKDRGFYSHLIRNNYNMKGDRYLDIMGALTYDDGFNRGYTGDDFLKIAKQDALAKLITSYSQFGFIQKLVDASKHTGGNKKEILSELLNNQIEEIYDNYSNV